MTEDEMASLYYTPKEVAEILGISDDAVLDLANSGSMPAFRVSPRITRIPIVAFDQWREGYTPHRRKVTIRPAERRTKIGEGENLPAPSRMAQR